MKQLFPASKKVLAKRGSHEEGACIRLAEKSGQEYITAHGGGLASGVTLPSYIVYSCKHLYNSWCQSVPAGALYGASGSA